MKIDAGTGGAGAHLVSTASRGCDADRRGPAPRGRHRAEGLAAAGCVAEGDHGGEKKPLSEKVPAAAANASTSRRTAAPDRPPGRIVGEGAAAVPE